MASPRLAHRAPTACAACYLQRPQERHIDYRAAIEGRLIDPSRPRGGHVDWVVLCEPCLRAGLALLPQEEDTRIAELEALLERSQQRAEEAETYSATLEGALKAALEREHVRPTVKPVEPKPAPKRKGRYEQKAQA